MKILLSILIVGVIVTGVFYLSYDPSFKELIEWGGVKFGDKIPEAHILKATKEKILYNKEIDWKVWHENGTLENKGKIIQYTYADVELKTNKSSEEFNGKVLVEHNFNGNEVENVDKRGYNHRVFDRNDGQQTIAFYSGFPFYDDGDKWYQTEVATTTIDAFNAQVPLISRLRQWLFKTAHADSINPFSGSGDGSMRRAAEATWALAHDNSTADDLDYTGAEMFLQSLKAGADLSYINRILIPFDTVAMAGGSTVSAATLDITVNTVSGTQHNGSHDIGLIQGTQADETNLVIEDFNNPSATTTPTEGASRVTVNATGDFQFTLDATGRGWVVGSGEASACGTDTGWTCLGLRWGDLDIDDVEPTDGSDEADCNIRSSEEGGTADDPQLTVTYSAAPPTDDPKSTTGIMWIDSE
jgi:hypothetical protein